MAYLVFHTQTAQGTGSTVSGNTPPGPPTNLAEQNLDTLIPQFRAQFNDNDTGDQGIKYRIEIRDADDGGGTLLWDSGSAGTNLTTAVDIGSLCEWITYDGSALDEGTIYYWRIKFWDDSGAANDEGDWSATTNWETFQIMIDPEVLITSVAQRTDGSKTFDIVYNLSDDGDSGPCEIQLYWRNSGAHAWTEANTATGDVGSGITHGVGKSVVWDAGTDNNNQSHNNLEIRVLATDPYSNTGNDIETGVIIDTLDPTAPGDFVVDSVSGTTVTLDIGSATVEDNFDKYRMFYKAGTTRPDEGDLEWTETFFDYQNYNLETQVTVTGLTAGHWYSFILYAYDTFGNKQDQVNHVSSMSNSPPVVKFIALPAQTTDGSQIVNVLVEVEDANGDEVSLRAQYGTAAGGPWTQCTITGTPTVDFGATPDVNNAETYQIGDVTKIETESGGTPTANEVGFQWDVGADSIDQEIGYYMRVTAYDWIATDTAITASTFPTDTLDPVNITLTLDTDPPDALTTQQTITIAWTEGNPNINEAAVQLDGSGGWFTQIGLGNTTTPPPIDVTHDQIFGNQFIRIRGQHTDDFGNVTTDYDSSTNYYVKPAAPQNPSVSNIGMNGADIVPVDNTADAAGIAPDDFEHALYIVGPGAYGWVQADGTVAGSEYWADIATWGGITTTGLNSYTEYGASSITRNPNDISTESEFSAVTTFNTVSSPPDTQNLQVLPPADGSKIYVAEADIRSADHSELFVRWYYWDSSTWVLLTTISGDSGTVSLSTYPSWTSIAVFWDAGTDVSNTELAGVEIRLEVEDVENTTIDDSAPFILDTLNPDLSAATLSFPILGSNQVTVEWSVAATEGYLDTYELYLSEISISDALAKNGIKWDQANDANLGTVATTSTIVTGLNEDTPYFVALFAVDIRGNENSTDVTGSFVSATDFVIEGYAYDQHGYFVPGALASAYFENTGDYVNDVVSDITGYYQIPVLNEGPYFVIISKEGYGSYVEDEVFAEMV